MFPLLVSFALVARAPLPVTADVVVYGATPAGIAAACAAAEDGESVLLIEPTEQIGGLVTCGLSHTDFRTFEGLSGAFLDFSQRVERHYAETYGPDSEQVRASFRGTFGEPKVNLAIFEQMLAERKLIDLRCGWRLSEVVRTKPAGDGRHSISQLIFNFVEGGNGTVVRGRVYIDATYEGDLMAMAGETRRVGREGRDENGESLAPEAADHQLQAYNFRFIMTREPGNRVAPVAPPNYDRNDFLAIVPVLESGRIKQVFAYPKECIFKAQEPPLPNGKYDINDVSGGLVRLSLPGKNLDWPTGSATARAAVFAEHLRDQAGLLYFLQNDSAVPESFRSEAREWGWCRDEFTESGHLPPQLYVREAGRMVGQYVFTERDGANAPGDARGVWQRDSIAVGDYGNNCHGTAHEGPRFGGRHTGEFYKSTVPYQIPYGVIVPQKTSNLLVPVAASSSHVGFCALRLEPIWMALGQAAGHAAHLARAADAPVAQVPVADLQQRLHRAGSATIYVSDVRPGDADFAAVQWWGTAGGLHGLNPHPEKPGLRGKNMHGQYYEAFPFHAAELEKPLDAATAKAWAKVAAGLGVPNQSLPKIETAPTRGDWIRAAYEGKK